MLKNQLIRLRTLGEKGI